VPPDSLILMRVWNLCTATNNINKGLLQVDLAKKIGVNEMTIVNWEKGRRNRIRIDSRNKDVLGSLIPVAGHNAVAHDAKEEVHDPRKARIAGVGSSRQ